MSQDRELLDDLVKSCNKLVMVSSLPLCPWCARPSTQAGHNEGCKYDQFLGALGKVHKARESNKAQQEPA